MTLKDRVLKIRLRILRLRFPGSVKFWTSVYEAGGNSGEGSYGNLAVFKAEVINRFIKDHDVHSIIEFGCGDGNQLSLMAYPSYLGLDVAPGAINLCSNRFRDDNSKAFMLFDPKHFKSGLGLSADLTLSLDVIFHLIERESYELHLSQLFAGSRKWVIIYGYNSNTFFSEPYSFPRQFTDWIETNLPKWNLHEVVKNRYPLGTIGESSWSDFYIYGRTTSE